MNTLQISLEILYAVIDEHRFVARTLCYFHLFNHSMLWLAAVTHIIPTDVYKFCLHISSSLKCFAHFM